MTAPQSTILYGQCWEDPEILRSALRISPQDIVVSITSGGCNTLALLLDNPKKIYAVDNNPSQNALFELKIASIKILRYDDFLEFIGVKPSNNRLDQYQSVQQEFSAKARAFWDSNLILIQRGIIHAGRFEQYFKIFRSFVLPLIHSKNTVGQLLGLNDLESQKKFYNTQWDNWRWRFFIKFFFGNLMKGRGRKKEFYRYAEIKDLGKHYLERTKYALTQIPISNNFLIEYILTGTYMQRGSMPPYIQEKNFQILKKGVNRITIVNKSLEEFVSTLPSTSISCFNLSDIFEVMSSNKYKVILRELIRIAKPGATLCYWNNLVKRQHPPGLNQFLDLQLELSKKLYKKDRAFFYSNLVIERVRK